MNESCSAKSSSPVRVIPAKDAKPGKDGLIHDEIGLMFSGGLDSTLTAVVLSERFQRIHLVTYRMGKGLRFVNNSKFHVRELKLIIGEEHFTHNIIDNKAIFRQLRKGFARDYVVYCNNKAPFIYCLNCKLAMHARSIIYCIENGLRYWADGAVEAQNDRPEMMLQVLKMLEDLYAQYGIEFSSPIYYYGSRDDERRELLKQGFTLGLRTGDLHKTVQPLCLPGIIYAYWHYSAYPDEQDVVKFAKSKLPIVRRAIWQHFKEKGTIPDVVSRVPAD